jgi:hypothetical protein
MTALQLGPLLKMRLETMRPKFQSVRSAFKSL